MINFSPAFIPGPSSTTSSPPSTAISKSDHPLPQSTFPPTQPPDASNSSLPNPHHLTFAPLLRTRSQRGPSLNTNDNQPPPQPPTAPLGRSSQQQRQQKQSQSEGVRTDAQWAEMQATLAEVELSAARGTHFFGPEHAVALEELRAAQIALAQAWARGEADEVVGRLADGLGEEGKGRDEEVGGRSGEGETEEDIVLARRRREANDGYFRKVSAGVLDVVGRLQEVAVAMGKVERESREVWSESESVRTGSGPPAS